MDQSPHKIESLHSDVEASFRCSSCEKFLHPPIRMCDKGHNMCDACRNQTCSVCHSHVGENSNTKIEALMKHFRVGVPCKYQPAGCADEAEIGALTLHEEGCPFRQVKCLVLNCRADIVFNQLETHMTEEEHRDLEGGTWVAKKASALQNHKIADLLRDKGKRSEPELQDAFKYMVTGTEVIRGRDYNYYGHEFSNYTERIVSHNVGGKVQVRWADSDKLYEYRNGADGKFDLKVTKSQWEYPFAIRSWVQSGTRFFANMFLGRDEFCYVWVTAAGRMTTAQKFRAEIRISSAKLPECSSVYFRPVDHLDSDILSSTSPENFNACLRVDQNEVYKHTKGGEVPFVPITCKVFEKVFVNLDKADSEEK